MSRFRDLRAEARADWIRLQTCWEEARTQWEDDVADQFERHQWQAWEERVPGFLDALERLEEITSRALKDI